jgi:anti-sigma factor RsiW
MITCRELTEFLDDYVASTLDAARRAVFDAHLAACEDCRNYLASYRATIGLSKAAGESIPQNVPPGIVKAVLASRKAKQ